MRAGMSGGILEVSWRRLEASWRRLGGVLGRFGDALGGLRVVVEAFWSVVPIFQASRSRLGSVLEGFLDIRGRFCWSLENVLGAGSH